MTVGEVNEIFQWTNVRHQYAATIAGICTFTEDIIGSDTIDLPIPPSKFNRLVAWMHTWVGGGLKYCSEIFSEYSNKLVCFQSPALPKWASENTPLLSGPLTSEQISWVGSINCLAGLLGSLFFGYFITRMGSKRSALFLAVPITIYWLLIHFGNVFFHILIARMISGLAGDGVQSSILLFTSEIANDE